MLYVTSLLIANIAASKIIQIGPVIFPAGLVIFPLSYIFDNILTEVYGYHYSRRIIWTGLGCIWLFCLVGHVTTLLPAAPFWSFQESYALVMNSVPRVVLASSISYLCSEFLNSYLLAKLKIAFEGKHYWLRLLASTGAGGAIDSLLFCTIAFVWTLPSSTILIASFETTMQRWIGVVFQADLYISSADYQGVNLGHPLSREIVSEIAQGPGIADIELITSRHISLKGLPTMISEIDVGFLERHHNILWKKAPLNHDFFDEKKNSHLVLASESFLERFDYHFGDHVTIPTPTGNQDMTIAGVFSDYGNEQGVLYLAAQDHELGLSRYHVFNDLHDDLPELARIFNTHLLRRPESLMDATLKLEVFLGQDETYSRRQTSSLALPHPPSQSPRHNQYEISGLGTVLIVILEPQVDPEIVRQELNSRFPGLSIFTNRTLREEILRIFHQTFSITYALELIGIMVAMIGLGMTFSNILMDRTKELTTLRTLGCTSHTMALATALEGGLLAFSATLMGIIASLGMGYILIYVINKQSFGWTLQFSFPYLPLALLAIAVILSGIAVAYQVASKSGYLRIELHE